MKTTERAQAVMLFAIVVPLTVLFALGIFDFMVSNIRVMETLAAADLAAHAGAQLVRVRPDGSLRVDRPAAQQTAAAYFSAQAPGEAVLANISCRMQAGRPTCVLTARVRSAGYLLPQRWIRMDALGTLAYGATRADQ